jgi:hypothetical protein
VRKSFEAVLAWLSARRASHALPITEPAIPLLEHERRLRELEKSGRILFLP